MEAKKIEIMKDWPEPKLVRNIQIFLGFTNFYCQFIKSFSKIVASLTLILKTTRSPNILASMRIDNKIVVVGFGSNNEEPVKKSGKLKSQNLAKS